MSARENKPVSLTPEQARIVERYLASGRFQSAGEVIGAGLRLLADEEAARAAALERVRQMIDAGAQELDRGDVVDGDEVFAQLRARRERLRRESQHGP